MVITLLYQIHVLLVIKKYLQVSVLTVDGCPYLITARKGNATYQPRTTIWKLNTTSFLFEKYQIIYEGEPISISTISTPYGYYLAAAYGYIRNTMNFGRIVIRK